MHYIVNIPRDVKGQEVVQFLIDKHGRLSQFKIIHSLGPDCDKEVIRVLSSMPEWNPGKEKGKAIPTWYSLPILINQDNIQARQ